MVDIHSFIRSNTKGGSFGPRLDFWYMKASGSKAIRFYRVTRNGDKHLYSDRDIHELTPPAKGVRPNRVDCPGDGCEVCPQIGQLYAAGDAGSRERAKQLQRKTSADFVIVLPDEPTGFKLWGDHSWGRIKDFSGLIAQQGGWYEPMPDGSDQTKSDMFVQAYNAGLEKVCGPKGIDLMVIYSKGAKPAYRFTWMSTSKVLDLAEDEKVPDPFVLRERINAKQAAAKGVLLPPKGEEKAPPTTEPLPELDSTEDIPF